MTLCHLLTPMTMNKNLSLKTTKHILKCWERSLKRKPNLSFIRVIKIYLLVMKIFGLCQCWLLCGLELIKSFKHLANQNFFIFWSFIVSCCFLILWFPNLGSSEGLFRYATSISKSLAGLAQLVLGNFLIINISCLLWAVYLVLLPAPIALRALNNLLE